jgi:ComF family protein
MDINHWIRIVKKGFIDRIFPFTCILCSEETKRAIDLCLDCEKSLAWLGHACTHCAVPLSPPTNTICGACLKKPFPFYKICIPFSYTGAIRHLITGLKFHRRLLYATILGNLLAEQIKLDYQKEQFPQLIIPVPLHKKRLRQRGFNQAIEIARPIKKKLKVNIDYKSCFRTRNTLTQSELPANQRRTNVKNAFALHPHTNLSNQHIALLDDVMTTGHTLTELSRILYHAGVKRIDVWCCARTYLDSF